MEDSFLPAGLPIRLPNAPYASPKATDYEYPLLDLTRLGADFQSPLKPFYPPIYNPFSKHLTTYFLFAILLLPLKFGVSQVFLYNIVNAKPTDSNGSPPCEATFKGNCWWVFV